MSFEPKDKTAFITGGASGLGLGMAHAFVEAGMRVVMADIRQEAIDAALLGFGDARDRVHGVRLDVTDRAAMAAAADEAERVFGHVHVLCNNAGLGVMGSIEAATYDDWDWMMGVMVGGPINGVQTFLPRLLRHGEGGHIVNTTSFSGIFLSGENGIYSTAKFAVVGLTEALRAELAGKRIGVSAFLAGPSRTNLPATVMLRPKHLASGYSAEQESAALSAFEGFKRYHEQHPSIMMEPLEAGRRVLRGMLRNDLYIITHPEFRPGIEARSQALLRAIPDEPSDALRTRIYARIINSHIYATQQPVPAFDPPTKR